MAKLYYVALPDMQAPEGSVAENKIALVQWRVFKNVVDACPFQHFLAKPQQRADAANKNVLFIRKDVVWLVSPKSEESVGHGKSKALVVNIAEILFIQDKHLVSVKDFAE